MASYLVIFEVQDPQRLAALKESLKSFSGYCPLTNQAWAITTDKKAVEVISQLRTGLDKVDRLFVIRSGTEAAWLNAFSEKHTEWLKKYL